MKSTEIIKKLQELDAGPDDGDIPCEIVIITGDGDILELQDVYDFYPRSQEKLIFLQVSSIPQNPKDN